MPKGEIKKTPVNKKIFMSIVSKCGSSIIKLGKCEDIHCTERTIRRALNDGKITPRFLDEIAKHLNVDPRLLSGELYEDAYSYKDDSLRTLYLSQLTIERYPYYRKRCIDLNQHPITDFLERLLSLFEISMSQYDDMDFEAQYLFQHDLFEAIVPIIMKHFAVDAYGRSDMPNLERIISDLENFRESHYIQLYADKVLRKKFLANPPHGITKSEIRRTDADSLMVLNSTSDD